MILFQFMALFFWGNVYGSPNPTLQLSIGNITPGKGNLMIAVHNKDNFLKSRLFEKSVPATYTTMQLNIELPVGQYAVAVYQDLNQNKHLDTNVFGIPSEPYGFSNNARPKWRAPTFEETRFDFYKNQSLGIKLEKW